MTRDELLRPADVQADYQINVHTLANWRAQGVGPAWFRCGPRRIVYRRSVVEAWIEAQEQASGRGGQVA